MSSSIVMVVSFVLFLKMDNLWVFSFTIVKMFLLEWLTRRPLDNYTTNMKLKSLSIRYLTSRGTLQGLSGPCLGMFPY